MKKINYIKFSLDLIMALLFVLFFNKQVLGGLTFHEIAGIGFAAAYFTHIFLNWKWVKNVTMKLFDRKLSWKVRGSYALNLLLLVFMSFIIISGIFISRVVFPNINIGNERWFQMTHISISFLVLALIGVHVGLHWQWVVNVWQKMWKYKPKKIWIRYMGKAAAVLILLFGIYEMNNTGFMNRLASASSIIGIGSQTMAEGGKGEMMGERGGVSSENSTSGSFQRPTENSSEGQNSFQPPSGERPDNFQGKMGGNHEGGESNVFSVIITYTGIMAVFVIVTYYLNKLTKRMQKNKKRRGIGQKQAAAGEQI
ncbi:DUF4405 domain-containing protein [Niallia nealsonii]|uniref:Flavinylation-associated cytochrome domain-containing protein n=1 Tax=Niallia nealsonii TaxID=115979 RepID=A0A2N0Z5J6_9BACI|nr:DUF4405 domain-containing protein [Niallia nealsonii]PKG24782.1 hypothetical protein CWS01_05920 [Niallia nealsonii]